MGEKELTRALAKTIGENARIARESLDWTREQAAERIGISYEFYARIERGHSLPGLHTFRKLVQALDTRADQLLGSAVLEVMGAAPDAAAATEPHGSHDSELGDDAGYIVDFARAHPRSVKLLTALIKEFEHARSLHEP